MSSYMTKRSRDEEQKLPTDQILNIVTDICNFKGSPNNKKEHFEKKYPDFVSNYVALFDLACQPNFDMNRLKYMLNLKDKIDEQKVSFDAASREVGQRMFNVYVKDVVDKM